MNELRQFGWPFARPTGASRAAEADGARKPQNLGPFQCVPVMAEATLDRLG